MERSKSKSKRKGREEQNLQLQGEKRPRGEGEEVRATSEEEVEEFYAILRRMHAAARMMSKVNPSKSAEVEENKKMMTKKATIAWRPTFQLEDFGRAEEEEEGSEIVVKSDPIDGEKKLGEDKVLRFLDLNADPDPELTLVLG